MKKFFIDDLRKRVSIFLRKNNLTKDDIKGYKINNDNHRLNLCVNFNNGKRKNFPIFRYRLNRKGMMFVGVVTTLSAVGIAGIYGSYYFNKNKEEPEIELKPDSEISMVEETTLFDDDNIVCNVETENSGELETESVSIEAEPTNNNVRETNVEEEILESNINSRVIKLEGSLAPCQTSYEYILNTYYEDIKIYGNRYGIDPAIIAALIMQETGTEDTEYYQTCYGALGLGKFNCEFFDHHTFHTYNFDTNCYEDYLCTYQKLKNNRQEQIKVIAMQLQENAIRYNGNISAMLICYNQGMGTVGKILNNVVNKTNMDNRSEVLDNNDPSLVYTYDTYNIGDKEYYNKVTTFLNFILQNEVYGSNYANINLPDGSVMRYTTNINISALKGAR